MPGSLPAKLGWVADDTSAPAATGPQARPHRAVSMTCTTGRQQRIRHRSNERAAWLVHPSDTPHLAPGQSSSVVQAKMTGCASCTTDGASPRAKGVGYVSWVPRGVGSMYDEEGAGQARGGQCAVPKVDPHHGPSIPARHCCNTARVRMRPDCRGKVEKQ